MLRERAATGGWENEVFRSKLACLLMKILGSSLLDYY